MAPVYDVVVSQFLNGLKTFDHILAKAEEHAKEKGLDEYALADARLIADMRPLSFQVGGVFIHTQMALDRFQGKPFQPPPPKLPEDEKKTIPELRATIQKALEAVTSASSTAAAVGEDDVIEMWTPHGPKKSTVKDSVLSFSLPNFFFHLQTAYAILRKEGVPIGKKDYLQSWMGW